MTKQMIIRLDEELYEAAKQKCKNRFGIGLTPLIKIFLKSFTTQQGVGFYVGDDDLRDIFYRWLYKKKFESGRKGCTPAMGPRLKDLYNFRPSSSWPPSWLSHL